MNANESLTASRPPSVQRSLAEYRQRNPEASWWAAGYGAIRHSPETQERIFSLAEKFAERDLNTAFFEILTAADRVASAGMWLVVHATYALQANLDGHPLRCSDF